MTDKTDEFFIITGKNATDSTDSKEMLKNLLKHPIIRLSRDYGLRCASTSGPIRSGFKRILL
jgi:hypothetical protein